MLVYGECECFVMPMLYVCVLYASCGSSQCCNGGPTYLFCSVSFFSHVSVWRTIWCVLTRHGGVDKVGSFDSFLRSLPRFMIVLCHIVGRYDFLPSPLLFLPSPLLFLRNSVNQCISRLYGFVVKGAA